MSDKLQELFSSLDQRWTPEKVALWIKGNIGGLGDSYFIKKVAKNFNTYMSEDFHRPNMKKQLEVASSLFHKSLGFNIDGYCENIDDWIKEVEETIGKTHGLNDFKHNRLNKGQRHQAGIDISRRQYNKLFRMAARLEKKAAKLAREHVKRVLTLASKSRLGSFLTYEEFSKDEMTACFIAYYVARCNMRSMFTCNSQVSPFDEICDSLMKICVANKKKTNWFAIAHVLPNTEIIKNLSDDQKACLLSNYFNLMKKASDILGDLWKNNNIRDDMIVRRGNDSTSWNIVAGAWNKLRDGWFSLIYAMKMDNLLEGFCPGKVLRLMAADVVRWHDSAGGELHEDTKVWMEIPRPWEVMSGDKICTKSLVDEICKKHGIREGSGWYAPRPGRKVAAYTPTPNLVHGVQVNSPELYNIFKKAGVFSGKDLKINEDISTIVVDTVREKHIEEQESKNQKIAN